MTQRTPLQDGQRVRVTAGYYAGQAGTLAGTDPSPLGGTRSVFVLLDTGDRPCLDRDRVEVI